MKTTGLILKGVKRVVSGSRCLASASSPPHPCSAKRSGMTMMGEKRDITRLLFCGQHFPTSHIYTKDYLRNYPFIQVDDVPLTDVPKVISNYNICVALNMRLDSNIIAEAKNMKLIMQYGVGLEGVDIDAATRCGIKFARIPGDLTGNAASCTTD